MTNLILAFIKARLKERSTWLGIIAALTGYGIHISPEMQNLIVTIGLILAGGVAAITPDTPSNDPTGVSPKQ